MHAAASGVHVQLYCKLPLPRVFSLLSIIKGPGWGLPATWRAPGKWRRAGSSSMKESYCLRDDKSPLWAPPFLGSWGPETGRDIELSRGDHSS